MRWCRTDICSCKLSAKVSLMLDNPFVVPSLCKLNHICVCFIQISTKSPANSLFPSGKAMFFLKSSPVLSLDKFQCNIRFLLRRPVFPDYLFFMTMMTLVGTICCSCRIPLDLRFLCVSLIEFFCVNVKNNTYSLGVFSCSQYCFKESIGKFSVCKFWNW